MNTALSALTVQRFCALQGELIALVEHDYMGFDPDPKIQTIQKSKIAA
jgi:hypothetical protein